MRKDLVLGTQIYLTDDIHSLRFEEKLTELGKGSSRLEGVWWLPSPRGEVRLVLSNTTDAALSVSVNVKGESPKKQANATLNLIPHETKVLDVRADILDREHGAMSQFGAISAEHNGTPGALLARAIALDSNEGFSLPVQFSNPAGAKSNNIQGAGLRVLNAGHQPLSAFMVVALRRARQASSDSVARTNGSLGVTISVSIHPWMCCVTRFVRCSIANYSSHELSI